MGFQEIIDKYFVPKLRTYGIARTYIKMKPGVMVSNLEYLKYIYKHPGRYLHVPHSPTIHSNQARASRDIPKGGAVQMENARCVLMTVFSCDLLPSNGKDWKIRREIIGPLFRLGWEPTNFGEIVIEFFQRLETTNSIPNLHHAMKLLTLDIIGKVLFGFDFQAIRHPESEHVTTFYTAIDADRFPVGKRRQDWVTTENFRKWLATIAINKSKSMEGGQQDSGNPPQDVLSALVQAWLNGKLEFEETLNEAFALIFAGHDTTATALTCAIYLLARHPEIQTKVRAEVNRELQHHTSSMGIPAITEIKRLNYLEAVIKETMRLYPPAPLIPTRVVAQDTSLGAIPLPKGTMVTLNLYALHRDEKHWENPDKFDPDRWLSPEGMLRDLPAWSAFTDGMRMCIGKSLAMNELRIVLSMLVRRYHLSLPHDSPHKETLHFGQSFLFAPEDLEVIHTRLTD
ncbi:cytochrome P450 [Basidiobolus meristosporus CBS 931.73]|uniref:Cytochrome P450 n=1 Tax=Basidiobolus meristosporus CBS 931.73 TaxID=1314790 RepID=A0A1Y1Y3E7_9FUNG|nr:cytochrome P450 [Basidiobolus meristosporus CBS 931.73]|eukprot:ORX92513.1 cytochrome P450 [Basidiobolus meristosporus CBS 931.73]